MKFLFVLSSSTNSYDHFKRFLPKTFTPHRARQTHQRNSHWCPTGSTGGFWNWLCSTKPNADNQIIAQFLNTFSGWLLFALKDALPIQVGISQRISDLAAIQKINYPKPFILKVLQPGGSAGALSKCHFHCIVSPVAQLFKCNKKSMLYGL